MSAPLQRAVSLPSGRVVELGVSKRDPSPQLASNEDGPLFRAAIELFELGHVSMHSAGAPLTVYALELRDFHALRGILTACGLLAEETLTLACKNCHSSFPHAPCAVLPLGPFVDGELTDPELDTALDTSVAHPIPKVTLGKRREARDVIMGPLSVEDALPLFRALAGPSLRLTAEIALAMGIRELGQEKNPVRIARALAAASEDAWSAVTDLYLDAHYSPRLFSIAVCPKCKARNDVDAPYDREFEPGHAERTAPSTADGGEAEELPIFDTFAERARTMAAEILRDEGLTDVAFVVEGGVPLVDDGGEPLLGSYVPGAPGDMTAPSQSPEITVYYRTFRAIWDEDGVFDWELELHETIAHEVEHHLAFLAGDDPQDDEEREQIRGETLRVLGRRATVRAGVRSFGAELVDFGRRTWPIWLIVALATLFGTITR